MLSIRIRLRLIQPLVVVLVVFGERAFGQDQTGRYDILKGHDGQSSCQLRDSVHAACSTSSPPALDVTPTPTVCTCNNVFFNLWSACSFASGNNTLPLFSSWLATCTNNSIDLGKSDAMKLGGNLGIDVPQWAGIGVPGNTSFDLERAVILQQSPNTWSILQISLPIVTALSGVMFTLLFVKMTQRRPNMRVHIPQVLPESMSGRLSRMIHPGRRVRRVNQSALEGWVIDGPPNLRGDNRRGRGGSRSRERERRYSAVPGEGRQDPQSRTHTPVPANANGNNNNIVRPPSPPDAPNRESTIPGHPSVYSETPRQSVVGRNSSTYTTPHQNQQGNGNELQNYPFGPQAQVRYNQLQGQGQQRPPIPALPSQHLHGRPTGTDAAALGYSDPYNSHANSFSATGTGASTPHTIRNSIRDMRLPNPFKRKPVAIVPVEASKGFRIDGSSEGSVSARESTAVSTSDAGVRMTGVSGFDAIEEEGHGHDRDRDVDQDSEYFDVHDGDGNEYGYDDEGTNLMTEDERRDSALDREDRLTSFTGGTRSTHGTSIDSRVRIVSPTASTISPRSTMGPVPPSTAGDGSLRPIALPPVPQVPAPLPPPRSARTTLRGQMTGGVASSSRTMMMTPIFEHRPSAGPSQLGRNGFSSIHPSTSSASASASVSESRPTPTRTASGDSINSSENPRPLPSPGSAAAAAALHQRSVSNESLRGRGPLPEPPSSGAPLNAFTNRTMTTSPPPIAHPRGPVYGHQQSHSGSGSSSHSGQRLTFMGEELYDAYIPTRRELMMEMDDHDADEASFYMPEPVERSGTPSSTSRTDPAVYFPGAVRGAGYGGV